MYFDMRQQI